MEESVQTNHSINTAFASRRRILAQDSRLIICAIGASEPGTMGGNTKISIELARCLAPHIDVHVFLPQHKLPTFTNNLPSDHLISFHTLADYPKEDKYHPVGASIWYTREVRKLFKALNVSPSDFVFGCSDFHSDVIPLYITQKAFGFKWLPSVFLFVPFVFENIRKRYRFPLVKYLIYWIYQRVLLVLMRHRASGFIVTNSSDFKKLPRRFAGKLFDYYGGVNVEQIPATTRSDSKADAPLSVVFCSRLHPQKGIDAFLDIWQLIIHSVEESRRPHLELIGNGDPAYEHYLQEKAERLGISDTITWHGYVNNEAKYVLYAKAELFVHPTVFDNNGMVAAEALCTGLPVIMYDIPALRHVYTTGCVRVPFGDKSTFAAEVIRLLSDPMYYTTIAPTPDQVAALRARWDWSARATEFDNWLKTI